MSLLLKNIVYVIVTSLLLCTGNAVYMCNKLTVVSIFAYLKKKTNLTLSLADKVLKFLSGDANGGNTL